MAKRIKTRDRIIAKRTKAEEKKMILIAVGITIVLVGLAYIAFLRTT